MQEPQQHQLPEPMQQYLHLAETGNNYNDVNLCITYTKDGTVQRACATLEDGGVYEDAEARGVLVLLFSLLHQVLLCGEAFGTCPSAVNMTEYEEAARNDTSLTHQVISRNVLSRAVFSQK